MNDETQDNDYLLIQSAVQGTMYRLFSEIIGALPEETVKAIVRLEAEFIILRQERNRLDAIIKTIAALENPEKTLHHALIVAGYYEAESTDPA